MTRNISDGFVDGLGHSDDVAVVQATDVDTSVIEKENFVDRDETVYLGF